jgi:hypothetical protein
MEISFIAKDLDVEACVEPPLPAKKTIPHWFKDTPVSVDGIGTSKACMPFVDAFTTGYIQRLWCDVEFYDDGKKIRFDSDYDPITIKKIEPAHVPIFDGFCSVELQWNTQWEPLTPDGYSMLYTHPLNQYHLPFMTFSGVIDTDKFNLTGPLRFLLKQGFNGVIKEGTPIYQMIPIKRDSWSNPEYKYDYNMLLDQNKMLHSHHMESGHNAYKKIFWQKKDY